MSPTQLTPESYLSDPSAGGDLLKKVWNDIPNLEDVPNHLLTDGKLVRFRGMVQDMPNPVYFYEKYSVMCTKTGEVKTRSGKFRDGLVCGEDEKLLLDSETTVNSERRVYYCVNVPGLNGWAQMGGKVQEAVQVVQSEGHSSKRPVEDMEVEQETPGSEPNKKLCVDAARSTEPNPPQTCGSFNLNCPIPSTKDCACVLHVYDVVEDNCLKLNDVVDAVGFVYVTSVDQDDVNLPPSLAPRLHVLALKTLVHNNPLLTEPTQNQEIIKNASTIRADLHLALTQLLLGDHLAAEYLICHLLSSVYCRMDLSVLGKFSLNLINVPSNSNYTDEFFNILSSLVPKSHFFPMSLVNMNTSDLVPVKDYDNNRLKSGVLQLSNRTHLVVDETKLEAGKLQERGVKNVQVLNTLLSEQAVNYDFKFYSVPFPMNVPVLVLSEGKSLLQCDILIKVVPDSSFDSSINDAIESVKTYLKEPLISGVRTYLTALSQLDFNLPEDMSQLIEHDLVRLRQENSKLTPDEMHTHMVLARLLSLSVGQNTLTKEVWERTYELERLRRLRM